MRVPPTVAGLFVLIGVACVRAESPTPEQLAFFENKVRPVLAEHCYECHGVKKQTNGLRLDGRALILKGSDYGAVVVAGNPEASKLIHAIRRDQAGQVEPMPKDRPKLDDASIAALTEWIQQGLPWPEEAVPFAKDARPSAKDHWAFQPVLSPPLPVVKSANLVYQPMDAFVLQKLEEQGLSLSAKTDRATRMRRVQVDLLGFPPTFEEVQAFVNDAAPEAYARLVDRLLASLHFGERWGRYWLDLARYADTKGYVFQEERRYPYAYTYRDWVIRAFNADMPYDQFLKEQLAADQVESPEKKDQQAALGFLTLGRRFLNNEADIIDDRLDVIFRSTQALTIGCARCHDHKFDPIPTADYYGLYGVLASSMEPKDLPELSMTERTPESAAFDAGLAQREAEVVKYRDERYGELFTEASMEKYLLATAEAKDPDLRKWSRERGLYLNAVQAWQTMVEKGDEQVFGIWRSLVGKPDEAVKELLQHPPAAAPELLEALKAGPVGNRAELAKVYALLLAKAGEGSVFQAVCAAPQGLRRIASAEIEEFFTRPEKEKIRDLRKECENFKATHPAAPPRAMAMVDKPQPVEPHVFIRGNQGRPGEQVPRQFLKVLSGPERQPFKNGSGRMELAQRIASRENPLTARVFVNRAWTHLFGAPLVDTPSDFGVRTQPPANPALLEHLAASFMEKNWSVKQLLREMLLSATYQQQSQWRTDAAAKDPDNRWLWRMNRKRMDFEALRDGLLVVAGQADLKMFGQPVEIFTAPWSKRRSIYGFVDRQNLPGTFRTFDFANPDTHAPKRFETTVPQQALFMLNSPFVQERAGELLQTVSIGDPKPDRVRNLIRRVFSREATDGEVQAALEYIKPDDSGRVWTCGYGGWDAAAKQVNFTPFTFFANGNWRPQATTPDPALGWVNLGAGSGHPGFRSDLSAVRRWTPGLAATISISGLITLSSPQSDGIVARIISSQKGLVGEWKVPPTGKVEASVASFNVTAGETLDFLVDCGGNDGFDSFIWNPIVQDAATHVVLGNAERDFTPPAPEAWKELAQALLCANEFIFVD